ncbi:hypothetical protein KGQ19_20605 [Catenulispora sp. NL8]|uniref:DUF4350 domain-containing protein n=1 Tax=Catenulispora pinistramenti TaxID=2705254 RepID=A0ABS5KT84_9ACTN|nr:DUF6421 family protein [Catenulispora pinistramenti]MBS2549268.1 hypothetical protein [Catenulispora pinistramenti]
MRQQHTGILRVLFDEAHSEAWTIDPARALAMNPVNPADAGYTHAADLLRGRGYEVHAFRDGAFAPEGLAGSDVLVIAHPADPARERTTGVGSPVFTAAELDVLQTYVAAGGGLVLLADSEQDNGSNLAALLGRFGVGMDHFTVQDAARRHNGNARWVLAERAALPESRIEPEDVLAGIAEVCFYRSGTLFTAQDADILPLLNSSPTADPADRPLAVGVRFGKGRVAVFADSDMFGDDSIADYDHRALWINAVTWASRRPKQNAGADAEPHPVASSAAFGELKAAIEELRPLQSKDGSIDFEAGHDRAQAEGLARRIGAAVEALAPEYPHDADYLDAFGKDLRRWAEDGFGVPDFLDTLSAFHPAAQREDGREHLVVFPMYTQNGNLDRNFEALIIRTVWPDWIAELERDKYPNPQFVPIEFVSADAFTAGYDTNSAVLFPETVAVRETPVFTWGAIMQDREAARFRMVTSSAAATLKMSLPPDAARLLEDQRLTQEVFVLWDLIHDRTHSHGDLPFDPFMIKQRMPYFLYSLEELRCDLTTFRAAVRMEREGGAGASHARLVQYTILFDRIFRFPITGGRVRNYDGLGGQLLFAYLHRNGVVNWTDNRLAVDWARIADAVIELAAEVETLYRDGIDRPKPAHWMAAYQLVAGYVAPNPNSVWAQGVAALPLDGPPKGLVDAVLPDEFPLSMFYEALNKKLKPVIEATRGVTA